MKTHVCERIRLGFTLFAFFVVPMTAANAQYVYVNNNNTAGNANHISAFKADSSGAFTALSGSPFSTGGNGGICFGIGSVAVVTTANGRFLYVTNSAGGIPSPSVSGFSINAADGSLTATPSSPYSLSSPAGIPSGIAASADGIYLFVGHDFGGTTPNGGGIDVFTIANDGSLALVSGSPYGSGAGAGFDVVYDSTRNNVISDINENQVSVFGLGSGGALSAITGSPFTTSSSDDHTLLLRPQGDFLFVAGGSDTAVTMTLSPTGALSETSSKALDSGDADFGAAIDPSGNVAYFAGYKKNQVYAFSVGSDGSLTAVSGSPFPSGIVGPTGMTIGSVGGQKLLFATNFTNIPPGTSYVASFKVGANGGITAASSTPLPTPYSCPVGIAFAGPITPTSKDQCKDGGWQRLFHQDGTAFKNQGDCIQYVNTGK